MDSHDQRYLYFPWRAVLRSQTASITVGDNNGAYAVSFKSDEPYYVQIDVDGTNAVLTIRTGSYTGPTLAVQAGTGLVESAGGPQEILLSSNHYVSIEEIEIASYAP